MLVCRTPSQNRFRTKLLPYSSARDFAPFSSTTFHTSIQHPTHLSTQSAVLSFFPYHQVQTFLRRCYTRRRALCVLSGLTATSGVRIRNAKLKCVVISAPLAD